MCADELRTFSAKLIPLNPVALQFLFVSLCNLKAEASLFLLLGENPPKHWVMGCVCARARVHVCTPYQDQDGLAGSNPHPLQHCADCGYKCISCRLVYPVPRSLALYPGVNRKGSLGRLRPARVHTQRQGSQYGRSACRVGEGGGLLLTPFIVEGERGVSFFLLPHTCQPKILLRNHAVDSSLFAQGVLDLGLLSETSGVNCSRNAAAFSVVASCALVFMG